MSSSTDGAGRGPGAWQRYRRVLRHRNFALLWTGQTVSWFGDSLYFISLLWLVQEMTGSTTLLGIVAACRTIPLLFGVFAGVLVDQLDRRRIMLCADLLRAAIVGAVPFILWAGALQPWHIPVIAFLLATAGVPFYPARQAVLPVLVKREDLAQANSLMIMSQQVVNVIGFAVAGVLIATIGFGPIFAIDAFTFLASVLAIWTMRLDPADANPALARAHATGPAAPSDAGSRRRAGSRWLADFKEGLRFIGTRRAMVLVIALLMLLNFLVAPFSVLLATWVEDILGAGPAVFGLLETAITAGMIAGSVFVGVAAARARRSTLALGSVSGFGLGALVFAVSRSVPLTVAVLALMGCLNTTFNIIFVTWAQTIVPRPMMGRVFGALETLSQAISPLGQALAGFAGNLLALPAIFGGSGAVLLAVAVLYTATPALRGAFNLIETDLSGSPKTADAAVDRRVAAAKE